MSQVHGLIPARGGSVRLPRKNLRTIRGEPLLVRTIRRLRAAGIERIIVNTDDLEIAHVAQLHQALVYMRPPRLGQDDTTIQEVIGDWLVNDDVSTDDIVVVAQCTTPLLRPSSILDAIDHVRDSGNSIVTVTPERHLLWSDAGHPLYTRRRNSTDHGDADYHREVGMLVAPAINLLPLSLDDPWPARPTMMIVDVIDAVDIDEYQDLIRARAGAGAARIELRYTHGVAVGDGHRQRCLTLAGELSHHSVDVNQADAPWPDEPIDVLLLDVLDTSPEMIQTYRDLGARHVCSLEDLGDGARRTDFTINELYHAPGINGMMGRWHGPRWAVLRPEFQGYPAPTFVQENGPIVVSFGGTDPADLTERVVRHLAHSRSSFAPCPIRAIVPPARPEWRMDVSGLTDVEIISQPTMAAEFRCASIVVTSTGRSVHEAAACGSTIVAVPVNERERAHVHCPGVSYVSPDDLDDVAGCALRLRAEPQRALQQAQEARGAVDGLGAERIAWMVDGLIAGMF